MSSLASDLFLLSEHLVPAAGSPDVASLVTSLAGCLTIFGDKARAVSELVLSTVVVDGQIQGLFYKPFVSSDPLIVPAARELIPYIWPGWGSSSTEQKAILDAISATAAEFNQAPYSIKPDRHVSPVLYWLMQYSKTPVFPLGLPTIQRNLLHKVYSGLESGDKLFKIEPTVENFTGVVIRYAKKVTPAQRKSLFENPSDQALYDLLADLLEMYPPVDRRNTGNSLSTYASRLRTALSPERPRDWEHIKRGGPPIGSGSGREENKKRGKKEEQDYEDLPEDDPSRFEFSEKAREYETEIENGLDQFGEPDTPPVPNKKKKQKTSNPQSSSHPDGKWAQTLRINLTRHTPGVLSTVEFAFCLQSTYEMLSAKKKRRGAIARLVLIGGSLFNWTKQLYQNRFYKTWSGNYADRNLIFCSDLDVVWLQPEIPIGWPKAMRPDKVSMREYLEYVRRHDMIYEPVAPGFFAALHPVMRADVQELMLTKQHGEPLISEAEYKQAILDLSEGLKRHSPKSEKITPGRLSATYQGLSNSLKFDPIDRYVIGCRPLHMHEMALNYTRVSVRSACEHHWTFVDIYLAEIQAQFRYLIDQRGFSPLPPHFSPAGAIPANVLNKIDTYTGSWSIPRISLIKEMFAFVRAQCLRTDLPKYEKNNWTTRRMALCSAVLKCLRKFDVDNLTLFQGAGNRVAVYAQQTKQKPKDEMVTEALRHVPNVIAEDWGRCIELLASDYKKGALLCLRDENMKRIPFRFEQEIAFILKQMGFGDLKFRAYGLRHLGRTLLREAGMDHNYLNLKLNHSGNGYEFDNPFRGVSYRNFIQMDDKCCAAVAEMLGM